MIYILFLRENKSLEWARGWQRDGKGVRCGKERSVASVCQGCGKGVARGAMVRQRGGKVWRGGVMMWQWCGKGGKGVARVWQRCGKGGTMVWQRWGQGVARVW